MVSIFIVNEEERKDQGELHSEDQDMKDQQRNYYSNQKFDTGGESLELDNRQSDESLTRSITNQTISNKTIHRSNKDQLHNGFDNQAYQYVNHADFVIQSKISTASKNLAIQTKISSTEVAKTPPWLTREHWEDLAKGQKRKKIRQYYEKQAELVKNFKEDQKLLEKFVQNEEEAKKEQGHQSVKRSDDILAKVSLLANLCILAAQCVAAGLSGSLVVMGMAVESATDVTAGLVIFLTNRAIKKRDHYKYPRGRTRLQPIGLVIISVIMAQCSVQVINKAIEAISKGNLETEIDTTIIAIMATNIVIKVVLMIICYMHRSPSCLVLAQDHRNDVMSNSSALICAYLGHRYWKYLDPIAAICISIYIIVSWFRTGREHVNALSGKTADSSFISRVIKICMDHKPELKQIDTVYAYHYGVNYLVEVHVVLDEKMAIREAHDIAEGLQRKLERLAEVERAFVHIDFETEHKPQFEHKVV